MVSVHVSCFVQVDIHIFRPGPPLKEHRMVYMSLVLYTNFFDLVFRSIFTATKSLIMKIKLNSSDFHIREENDSTISYKLNRTNIG